jgi:hypothetical protein
MIAYWHARRHDNGLSPNRPGSAMAIEYLLVTYPEARAVLADGVEVGSTNHTLLLPCDEYEITLAGGGYTPASQDIVLSDTSEVKPMVVPFAPAAASGAVSSAATGDAAGSAAGAKTNDA